MKFINENLLVRVLIIICYKLKLESGKVAEMSPNELHPLKIHPKTYECNKKKINIKKWVYKIEVPMKM